MACKPVIKFPFSTPSCSSTCESYEPSEERGAASRNLQWAEIVASIMTQLNETDILVEIFWFVIGIIIIVWRG